MMHYCNDKKLISLQIHLNIVCPDSLINTLQNRPLYLFFLSGARATQWWNRPITVLITTLMLQMTGPYYLQQPWRLWSYWFSVIQFFFFCLWMVFSHSRGQRKQPWGLCVCCWQLSIKCQWDESHPLERHHSGERQGGGSLPFLCYLSFSFTALLCLLVWLSHSLWFFILHTLFSD